ncbi:MAG TPA: protein-L-isoaspartate(D-aspartate) O-methyltransferase [Fervidobacterium sp.]|nr:protein-L-isoaspartate(D-aspartate) O-methyltransferase [Fervidobacterium sp.]HOP81818.1 protein-L-isoaspartate(D-aspartate) O-methyltransferase [Fervidobacterium sp.]HPC24332.1 protein-L-isoaspartate(D-aspartate) O-methyltransferase [Fervidobacterium sp.]HPT59105.1 protein-L-isoaspartate(D-aspartate) O-methyltransferase [Fervidobacterium sp.]HPV62625.1 protein-L-isoaspartate(D-aspartate) O-methyltransferase [Fervidobacterium sp.]
MYEYLVYHGVAKEVIEAMNKIDRKIFVSEEYEESAYLEVPLPIGFGQTISAPHMVGIMCSALNLSHGDKVLEIGTGSGYNAAVISLLVGDDGHIYTIERIAELAEIARRRMELLRIKNVTVVVGDGKNGLAEYSPFDKIVVTCYARKIPEQLLSQLSDDGILLCPVGNELVQVLKRITKVHGKIHEENLMEVKFVPLI